MHYFITYDITEDKLRRRVALLMQQQAATRVQKSVWLLQNRTAKQINSLQHTLNKMLTRHTDLCTPTDSILCIPVQSDRIDELVWVGSTEHWQEILKKLLFIWL